jgi:carbonic anhydrase/SulP family sulfate permease
MTFVNASSPPLVPSTRSPFTSDHAAADLLSGLVVFLVALPLCLGIALASNAPLISGVIAGIVAGVVVGWLSGSHVTVSGPAAGLTAVVAAEIAALGSFEAFLVAVIFAGVIQVGLGLAQVGFIKSFVPTSVVRGLLSAIGIILILKQIPHLVGRDTDPEGEMSFLQPDRLNTFSELWESLLRMHPGAAAIGIASLALLLAWNRSVVLRGSGVPAPLAVVLLGVAAAFGLDRVGGDWMIEASHRVQVPVADSVEGFLGFLHTPDFSQVGNPAVYTAALAIAVVASLQALLTSEAVDRLDRDRRTTPANRELLAQGIGNCVSGLLGGLPLTCEIVRSTVNVDAGARTRLATIMHGVLLAAALVIFPRLINLLPLSCLAAILIATGLRLASPRGIGELWRAGIYQFVPYAVTVVGIVLTDPLQGIIIGLLTSVAFILWSNLRRPMRLVVEHHLAGDVTRVELANQVSFLNRAALRRTLDGIPRGRHVLIDAHASVFIDPDILEMVREFRDSVGPARGVHVSTRGFRKKYGIGDQIQFVDFSTRELQQELTPMRALEYLRAGNERFRTGRQLKRDLGRQMVATAVGQHPVAVVLSCIDSRSPAELLFDLGLGDVFSVRVAGNICTPEVLGSMEFACAVAGAKLVVVLGHTRCGAVNAAVKATCNPGLDVAPGCGHLAPIVEAIGRAVDDDACRPYADGTPDRQQEVADEVARRNVALTVGRVLDSSRVIRELVSAGRVGIVGMLYDVASGTTWTVDGTAAGLPDAKIASMQAAAPRPFGA